MGAEPGSERLDPGINLKSRPDSLFPINIIFNKLPHDRDIFCLKDSENVGAPFRGPQRDERSLLFKGLKTCQVLITIGSTLHKSIGAVRTPQDKTGHSDG